MKFVGLLRVKNEQRWIRQVLESITTLCDRVLLMDDHSTDGTIMVARSVDKVQVIESPFEGLDEARDKNWLLQESYHLDPEWILMIDGDEVLEPKGPEKVRALTEKTEHMAFSLQVLYLWDRPDQIRIDGVYSKFRRPSLFRVADPHLEFKTTGYGGNFHCGNVPRQYFFNVARSDVQLLHYGYIDRAMRLKKFEWYNEQDPNNESEDCYRHMVIGDHPDYPAGMQRKHGGPLQLRTISNAATNG